MKFYCFARGTSTVWVRGIRAESTVVVAVEVPKCDILNSMEVAVFILQGDLIRGQLVPEGSEKYLWKFICGVEIRKRGKCRSYFDIPDPVIGKRNINKFIHLTSIKIRFKIGGLFEQFLGNSSLCS